MSSTKQQPTPAAQGSCDSHGHHDGHADLALDTGGDGPHLAFGLAGADVAGGADLGLLGALAHGADVHGDSAGGIDTQSYDGHVALTLDPGFLPGIDSTLDALTNFHDLFDVPVLDVACLDDALPT
jgi:hypothetical protein